jgi:uncharacterized membrane protein HdeD (DUF308 family)
MTMSSEKANAAGAGRLRGEVRDRRRLLFLEGVILTIFGVAAIVLPEIAIAGISVLLGWLFLGGGVAGLATSLMARNAPGYWWAIASSGASIVAGAILTIWPMPGFSLLSFVLAAFLAADGLLMIMFGIEHRRQMSRQWTWLVVNGAIDLVLAPLILGVTFAAAPVWLLPLVIGIDMLFGGSSLIALAVAAREK